MQASNAFSTLTALHEQARAMNLQGGVIASQSSSSRGIGFLVNGEHFFCDADLIREIAVPDELIFVPQSKAWMRGVYNSKGVLYSVADLGMLAGLEKGVVHQRGHVMLIKHANLQCSLLVNRVVGFRDFNFDGVKERAPFDATKAKQQDEWWDGLSAYMGKTIEDGGINWRYIDIAKLLTSEVFLEVQ